MTRTRHSWLETRTQGLRTWIHVWKYASVILGSFTFWMSMESLRCTVNRWIRASLTEWLTARTSSCGMASLLILTLNALPVSALKTQSPLRWKTRTHSMTNLQCVHFMAMFKHGIMHFIRTTSQMYVRIASQSSCWSPFTFPRTSPYLPVLCSL